MLKFSFNSTTLRNMGVFEALLHIQAAGYDGVELMLNDSHLHPLHTPLSQVWAIRDFCFDRDIRIASIATGGDRLLGDVQWEPSLITSDAAGRRQRIDLLKRSIEVTQTLGAPMMNFNTGKLQKGVAPSQAHQYLCEAITELLQNIDDLTLVVEPEPDFFIGTSTAGLALLKEIDDPRFWLNLDIGHVNCSEDDCYGAIERAMPFTRHIHIEDIKQRVHRHEIPGEGDIDFPRVMAILEEAHYDNYVSVELHNHTEEWQRALKESLTYLHSFREVHA